MKKIKAFLLLILIAVLMLVTCKPIVSLGEQVDVKPPEGEISYPEIGANPIRGTFLIKGRASDDEQVSSVSVVFENQVTGFKTKPEDAKLSSLGGGNFEWQLEVKNELTEPEDEDVLVKPFNLLDGKYTARVTITDKSGKKIELIREYMIDNTPPVFIVSRPSTVIDADGKAAIFEQYGAELKIVGEAGELNELETLSLITANATIKKSNRERSINLVMTEFKEGEKNYYKTLYDAQNPALNYVEGNIYLEDNASLWNGNSEKTSGNISSFYYIKNAIEKDVLSKGYTAKVIHDYFAGQKGSESGTEHDILIYKLSKDEAAIASLKNNRVWVDRQSSTFNLDPDKTPGFKVIGYDTVTDASLEAPIVTYGNNTSLTFELHPNKDGTSLLEKVDLEGIKKSEIKISLYRGNDSNPIGSLKGEYKSFESTELFNVAAIEDLKGITISGIIKITTPIPVTLKPGYYRAALSGKDVVGNEGFAALDAEGKKSGYSILKFEISGQEPVIYPNSIEEYHSKKFDITGKVKNFPAGKLYYWLGKHNAEPAELDEVPVKDESGNKVFEIKDIDVSKLSDGKQTVTIKAMVESTKAESYHEVDFIVDKTAPDEAKLDTGIPTTFSKWSHTFTGTASDKKISEEVKGSGIERVGYKVGYKKEDGTIKYQDDESPAKLIKPAEGSTEYKWEAIVTFDKNEDNYLKVIVYDKAGNSSEKQFGPYKVDTDAPQINVRKIMFSLGASYSAPPSGQEEAFKVDQDKVIGNGNKRKASFRILAKNTFGIKSVKVSIGGGEPKEGIREGTGLEDGYEIWKVEDVDLVGGKPQFKIMAESNKNLKTEWYTNIIVDFTAPTITQTSPHLDGIYFNEVNLSGSVDDKSPPSGVNKETIKYKIGNEPYGTEHKHNNVTLSSLEVTESSWTIKIPDISKYKDVLGVTAPSSESSVYKLPITIKAEDKAGNVSAETIFEIKFDPNGGTPTVIVVSPKAGESIGGDVVISGTSNVADPASGKFVKEITLQLRKEGQNFGSWTLAGNDYGAGYTIVTSTSPINYWNHILTQAVRDAIFADLPAGTKSVDLYFRVKGKNNDDKECEWTSERKFILSKDVAQFSEIKLNNTPYAPTDRWIKGDGFNITGKILHNAGIKNDIKAASVPPLPLGTQSLNNGHTNGFSSLTGITQGTDSGYEFTVPIKTSEYKQKSGEIEFDIIATDDRGQNAVPVSYKIRLKYDNSKPAAVFGQAAGKFKQVSFTATEASGVSVNLESGETIAQAVARLKKNLANLVLFAETKDGSAKAVKINDIVVDGSNAKVTFADTPDFKGNATCILLEQNPVVFDKTSSDYQLQGFAYDTGSKTKSIAIKLDTNNKGSITKFDAEGSNFVSFTHAVKTNDLSDDKYELTLTPTDDADNEGNVYSCDVFVRNKPLKITDVSFSTDLNGNGSYQNESSTGLVETVKKTGDGSLDSVQNYSQTLDITKEFTLKKADKSQIKFALEGGEGSTRNFTLYKVAATSADPWALDTAVKSGSLTAGAIDFLPEDFAAGQISDGDNRKFVIVLTDGVAGDPGRKLTLKVKFNVKTKDTRKPSVFIAPFYWNGEGDNSLASNDRTKGHIEIKKVSTGASLTGESDVSGAVVLRGTAYHPTKLTKLTLKVNKYVGTDPQTDFEKTETYTSGSWTSSNGLTVKDIRLDVNGHWIEWEYTWTTSDVGKKDISIKAYHNTFESGADSAPGGFATAKTAQARTTQSLTLAAGDEAVPGQFIRIVGKTGSADADASYLLAISKVEGSVVEWKGKLLPEAADSVANDNFMSYYLYPVGYAGDEPSFNKPVMSVNVVPYVTGIKTALSKLGGNDPDLYARTALGRYPVQDKEKIEIQGFNLTGAAVTVDGVGSGSLSGTASPWELTLADDAKSGALELTVGSVAAINNLTDNAKPYNKAKKTASNDKLTDDLFLDVWQFNSLAAVPHRGVIMEPVMRINPLSGMIGFAFTNGPDYFSMSNGTNDSYTKWQINYDDYGNVDFVYDSAGKSHGVVVGRDINSGGNQGGKFAYFTSQWGTGSITDQAANYNGQQSLRLESIGQVGDISGSGGPILDKTRIQHPALAAAIRNGTETRLYLAYYDGINDQIRFKYGTISDNLQYKPGESQKMEGKPPQPVFNPDGTPVMVTDYTQPSPTKFGQFVDEASKRAVQPYSQDNVSIVAGEYKSGSAVVNTGNTTGTYLSLGVVSDTDAASDTAVLIWFDETNRKLKYTYKTNPQNGSHASQSGDGNGTWKTPIDVFEKMNVGEYCKIAVDKKGGIHIAAFDSEMADLKYAYLSKYDAEDGFKTATVDAYGITGTYITLDVAYTAAGGSPVPYIGYYSASAGCSKIAYLVDTETGVSGSAQGTDVNGYFTGKWEVSVVPTASRVQQDNINVGVWKTDEGVIKNSVSGNNEFTITNNNLTGEYNSPNLPTSLDNKKVKGGKVYGNGTANPVLAYAIRQAMNGYIETAQKK